MKQTKQQQRLNEIKSLERITIMKEYPIPVDITITPVEICEHKMIKDYTGGNFDNYTIYNSFDRNGKCIYCGKMKVK